MKEQERILKPQINTDTHRKKDKLQQLQREQGFIFSGISAISAVKIIFVVD